MSVPGQADLVVHGGTVVNATGSRAATVLIAGGRITALLDANSPLPSHARAIDATGQLVIPGGVDPHCHVGQRLGDVSMLDDHEQASIAALWGGTTTIIDFAIPEPGQTPLEAAHTRLKQAGAARCDTALHGGVVAWDHSTRGQLFAMADLGVRTTKLFTTYRDGVMADTETIRAVMATTEELGGVTLIHAEQNHIIETHQKDAAAAGHRHSRFMASMRPEQAELESVKQVLTIAEQEQASVYFVHQTTADVVDLVRQARARGVRVYSETCPHYLVLDDSLYEKQHPERYVCCPPLRSTATRDDLRAVVLQGHVDTIGSDHCCYSTVQKSAHADDAVNVPNGLPGVETRLTVTFDSLVSSQQMAVEDFVALTSTNPARLNGLRGKGYIAPGADADLVVFDPHQRRAVTTSDLHMATDYTPYEGHSFTGWPTTVIAGGRVVVDPDGFHDPGPIGRHLRAQSQLDGHRHLMTSLVRDATQRP
ncbi:amidohydrolase family protein [Pedococcus sp. 5OH_020]|uniref:amidohydrolase family protein n=1 Tax=Pedococcus sp. 5OH_020 TaxID=2989814 RepID=UPI0022E9DFB6|nr:amidohydrolase family protein [Pedococcus sp. 5OH_020]